MQSPVILMTPDLNAPMGGQTESEYIVRANYAEAIVEAGGLPLILPYSTAMLGAALDIADGVIITGTKPGVHATPVRRAFELDLIDQTLRAGKPLLGICNGMQLIGEWLGATFAPVLARTGGERIDHMPAAVPDQIAHTLTLEPGSYLAGLNETHKPVVNSFHRHMLTGEGRFLVAARAPDDVIEAIEGMTGTYCLGVQWHPEYRLTAFDRAILRSFVQESRHVRSMQSTWHRRVSSERSR